MAFMVSCTNEATDSKKNKTENNNYTDINTTPGFLKFSTPVYNEKYRTGDKIPLAVTYSDDKAKIDSIVFSFNGKKIGKTDKIPYEITWNSTGAPVGNQKITASAYAGREKKESKEVSIIFLSDIKPKGYTYKINKVYNHDITSYTQGLVIDKGIMYEGAGEKGASSLRKIKLETGEILKSVSLASDIFGEGVTVFGNKIFQITWQSNVCFVYDLESFTQTGKFNYSTEGWGITTDGKQLIMSDGTSRLYFMNPENFSQLSTLDVYDYDGEVEALNELEFIKGEIWANVYQENFIIRVEPSTGRVIGKIDLTGILDKKYITNKIDVLNGIAYDALSDKIYVTGKWWPKLFEIEVVEKK